MCPVFKPSKDNSLLLQFTHTQKIVNKCLLKTQLYVRYTFSLSWFRLLNMLIHVCVYTCVCVNESAIEVMCSKWNSSVASYYFVLELIRVFDLHFVAVRYSLMIRNHEVLYMTHKSCFVTTQMWLAIKCSLACKLAWWTAALAVL